VRRALVSQHLQPRAVDQAAGDRIAAAREKAIRVIEKLRGLRLSRAAELVEMAVEETLAYYAFPEEHWRWIRTNNPLERILREIRRRTRVVGAFPDGTATQDRLIALVERGIAAVVVEALIGIGRAPASAGPRRLAPLRARPALRVSVGEQQSHYCDTEQNKTDCAHGSSPSPSFRRMLCDCSRYLGYGGGTRARRRGRGERKIFAGGNGRGALLSDAGMVVKSEKYSTHASMVLFASTVVEVLGASLVESRG
jgi:hypothetical protein